MQNEITVTVKSTYGVARCYPVCETAKLLAELAGSISFTSKDVEIMKKLGYEFKEIPAPHGFKFPK